MPLLLIPFALASCSNSSNKVSTASKPATKEINSKNGPATVDDIFLYRGIGASFLCNASAAGVDFPKAVGIASATYAQVLNGRHGGRVSSAGKEKLSSKQLFAGAEFQIITGALQYCPNQVPKDVKAKIDEIIEKQKTK